MSYTITSIIPQLPSIDFEKSKKYYVDELGCKLIGEHPDILIFLLNEIEIHLWKCNDKKIAEASSCYIKVKNIDSLYDKYKTINNIVVPLKIQSWGMKEFYLLDDSGNLLKFGEKIPN